MIMSPRTWIAAFAVIASTTTVRIAHADGKNEIRAVTFDEAGGAGATNVHVRGADAPTFTVYKLERPARVVIDMPQARLADVLKGHESAATFAPNTWAVSTIAAQPMDDNGVRVIVTLARPGRYDVKTVGNEVVVMVSPRDPAPKNASPEELVRAQQQASAAESARAVAEKQAAAATATASQSRAEADAAKAEAERLRKTAADQLARAEAAQRAVDQAKHASAADLDAAKATAIKAKQDAEAAKSAAATAQVEAERTRKAADKARQDALAEAASAKADAARAHDDANRAQAEAATAKAEADQWKTDAARTKSAADKKTAEAEMALARAQAEATAAKQEAAKQRTAAEQARRDADRTNAEAANAKSAEAKRAAELAAMKSEAAARAAEAASAKSEAAKRTAEAEAAKTDAAKRAAELDAVMRDANKTKTASQQQVAAARTEAANAKAEAARARSEAETARVEAAADKKKAEAARGDAEKMLKDAKSQLSSLDQKMTAAQALDDKARAANAAAQAREEAARDVEAKAKQARAAAELAAKQAQDAQSKVAASQRAKAAADAKAAEDRLADARRATAAAELQRRDAETLAQTAKKELEQSRSALANVEQQRTEATSLATAAAKKRSDAEAAATDASRRRSEAEVAAADAAKQKKAAELAASDAMQKKSQAERDRADAEAQRVAALDAARSAQQARDAAEKQRKIAEKAADTAVAAKSSAETSLGALTAKRQAAERAAADLEARAQAEAKAQAQIAAAQTRKASDDEVAKAKAELAKLAADRKQAEGELADRRKAVALQQAEATRLETAATQAHDAANREETRRAELAQKRTAEETALAAARSEAAIVKAQLAAKPAAPAPKQVAEAKPAPKQVADAKPTKVTAIDFKGDEAAGQVTIAVGDDANVQIGEITANHAELIVDNAELAQKLERKLDVSKLGSPVRAVSSFRDRRTPNRVRLVAELSSPATPTVDRDGGTVRWHFTSVEAVAKRPVKVTNVPSPVVGGFGAASTPVAQQTVTQLPPQGQRRRVYHGATIDLDIRDAPIHDLLRLLSETGHVNIVIPDTVTPKVTVKLKRVPWDQALEVILQSNGLWYRREGNLYRIATRKELDTEDQEEAARRDAALKAEAPRVERQGLNYASASELKPRLESMLSPHGRIEVDERTNALLINDVAANRAEIIRLALELDTQTPQISIEARIVEARSTFVRQIGVQWGGNAIAGAGGGNATGLIWPSSIAVTGANTDQQTISTGVAAPSDFAVNLPAATGAGEGGALGFSLGSIGGNFNINLRLSALEDTGTVRIISAPKITVLNNKLASISQGVSIPISVVSAAGTNTQFVQADLKLEVTPYVSQRDCAIAMNLVVQKNEPDFVNVGARGDPTILRKEAKTQMLVADGETTVLGGIYTRNAGVAYKKIPLFGDIPVLGWLFKNRRENDDRTEILVFITPKITNKGSLPCVK